MRIRRYRVTVEEIQEEPGVLEARLRELWEKCDNHHHTGPIKAAASPLGVVLDYADLGKRRPAR